MGISLARPTPEQAHQRWALHCAAHAQGLRRQADAASPLQTERAIIQYGAAVAMERAASYWSAGERELAQVWMSSAGSVLTAALVEVPWR